MTSLGLLPELLRDLTRIRQAWDAQNEAAAQELQRLNDVLQAQRLAPEKEIAPRESQFTKGQPTKPKPVPTGAKEL